MLQLTKRGIFSPEGKFTIDGRNPKGINIVTHGHTDHLKSGSKLYLATPETCSIIKSRFKKAQVQELRYGKQITIENTKVSLHPAGHVLGSAQVRIESGNNISVVTGDYKRQPDPTCKPFELVKCHTLITEATFGHPVYEWPEENLVLNSAAFWIKKNQKENITSIIHCYSLGKAQRILTELEARGIKKIYVQESIETFNHTYRKHGHKLANAHSLNKAKVGSVIMLSSKSELELEGEKEEAYFSGWALPTSEKKWFSSKRGFVISDHADFPTLIKTALESEAKQVLTMHGYTRELSHELRKLGLESSPFEQPKMQHLIEQFL
ncbi:MAG: hypothetical protein AABW79_04110 [Nanoarchaeota archaeon]